MIEVQDITDDYIKKSDTIVDEKQKKLAKFNE